MLTDILRNGFAAANQRPGLLFADILWKALWIVLTFLLVIVAVLWFSSDLPRIDWTNRGLRGIDGLIAASLFRQLWLAKRADAMLTAFAAMVFSSVLWIALEAFFRQKL